MREENLFRNKGEADYGVWLSVDVICVTPDGLVVIERAGEPHRGETTLPGGLVKAELNDTIGDTTERVVREKVGAVATAHRIITAVSDPGRDERGHTVSIVVLANIDGDVTASPTIPDGMPFDHSSIARNALAEVYRDVFSVADVARVFFGGEGTIRDYAARIASLENLLGMESRSEAAIVKQLLRVPYLGATGEFRTTRGRPAEVFRIV